MSFFGKNGLAQEDMYKLRELFSSIIKAAKKDPEDFEAYYKKEASHIASLVLELPREEAFKKALEKIETSARFELVRKDVVRGLLDGTI